MLFWQKQFLVVQLQCDLCFRLISNYEQYSEYDYFLTSPELPNPWITDNTELWDVEKTR